MTSKPRRPRAAVDTEAVPVEPGPPPRVIRCTRSTFIARCPVRKGRSWQIRFGDVFADDDAAWLWEHLGAEHFEVLKAHGEP